MMKYALVYLIEGDARAYHGTLTHELSQNFGIKNLSEKIIPHLTLKSPFYLDDISPVEGIVGRFSNSLCPFTFALEGFGHFDKEVIFMDTRCPEEMEVIPSEIVPALREIRGISFSPYDESGNYHATLAYASSVEQFKQIMDFLQKKEPPYFQLALDNLAIIKKPDKKWEIHKKYGF